MEIAPRNPKRSLLNVFSSASSSFCFYRSVSSSYRSTFPLSLQFDLCFILLMDSFCLPFDLFIYKVSNLFVFASSNNMQKPSEMRGDANSGIQQTAKPFGKSVASAARSTKTNRKGDDSCSIPMKPNGKAPLSEHAKPANPRGNAGLSFVNCPDLMLFKDVSFGPHESELRFRLIHFWEAKNPLTRTLIGEEMLLVDEQGTVIQGFIPPGRIDTYLPHMRAGSVYRLNKFYGSKNKSFYRVSDHPVTITFSWNTVLSVLNDTPVSFPEDRFRFHRHDDFKKNCDLKGDLYDYVGHLKLVNGQTLTEGLKLNEEEIVSTRRVLLHVQTHDESVMKTYLWDKAATDFCKKFKSYGSSASVILVTTVNSKRYGGTISLASMSSSRVFLDTDVQPSKDYLSWLTSNSAIANKINADAITKLETVTIGELLSYMKQPTNKVAWFECTATIDDVVHGSVWYYIACGGCNTKATKGPTSLMCKKCGLAEVAGVAQYLTKLSVYDKNDQAVFVLLCDAGRQLTGKHAAELANENAVADHIVPVPQALLDTIGQTHKFVVKVSKHNLTGKTQALTVTKVLPPPDAEPVGDSDENIIEGVGDESLKLGNDESGVLIGLGST